MTACSSATSRTCDGTPIYVHAKVCVIDDVWMIVGSDNVNRRSWTHDSELSCAVIDATLDEREPRDPAGLGDGARRVARDTRLHLWREHLGRDDGDDVDLVDPESAFAAFRRVSDGPASSEPSSSHSSVSAGSRRRRRARIVQNVSTRITPVSTPTSIIPLRNFSHSSELRSCVPMSRMISLMEAMIPTRKKGSATSVLLLDGHPHRVTAPRR